MLIFSHHCPKKGPPSTPVHSEEGGCFLALCLPPTPACRDGGGIDSFVSCLGLPPLLIPRKGGGGGEAPIPLRHHFPYTLSRPRLTHSLAREEKEWEKEGCAEESSGIPSLLVQKPPPPQSFFLSFSSSVLESESLWRLSTQGQKHLKSAYEE